jgi:hypothetical protein
MAAGTIMRRFGRPSTPTDQAWIESLFAHVRANGRTWRRSATPADSSGSATARDTSTTPGGCTPASATSPRTTSTTAVVTRSAKPAATGSPQHAKPDSPTVEHSKGNNHERVPSLAGYSRPRCLKDPDVPHREGRPAWRLPLASASG